MRLKNFTQADAIRAKAGRDLLAPDCGPSRVLSAYAPLLSNSYQCDINKSSLIFLKDAFIIDYLVLNAIRYELVKISNKKVTFSWYYSLFPKQKEKLLKRERMFKDLEEFVKEKMDGFTTCHIT